MLVVTTSDQLANLVRGIIGDLNVQCKVDVAENPERPELPCVKFDDIMVWAFPRGGSFSAERQRDDAELTWNVDLCITTTSSESGPQDDIKDVYNGRDVLLAIQAGLKVMLSRKLEYAIEKVAINEAAKDWLTGVR